MRVSRPILVAVAAWLVVVAVGSTLVWAVISRAGDGVVSADSPASSAQPTGSPTTRPTITRRTWQGVGGTVAVTCRGTSVSLDSAQPDSGFTIEVHERGPQRVEVRFEGRDDESDDKSRVRAGCAGGLPVFEVDTD